jgi:hypothetical protein
MKNFRKTSFYVTIIIFAIFTSTAAYSSGFIFHWEPFKVDKDLFFISQGEKSDAGELPMSDLHAAVPEDKVTDILGLSSEKDSTAVQKPEKKSFLDKIKIKISPADNVTVDKQKIYTNSDEEQISKFIDAMTTLIYNDKKIESLETIGKIIEPSINLYFEF